MKTLAKQFTDLMAIQQKICGPFPEIQIQEMNRAFYCGAAALFFTIMNDVTALPDAAAEIEMQKLDDEIRAYFKALGQVPPRGLGEN